MARNKIGRPSRPKFGRLGHVKTGKSGGAGGVATTPVMLGVSLPVVVVVAVGLTVAPVGGAALHKKKISFNHCHTSSTQQRRKT